VDVEPWEAGGPLTLCVESMLAILHSQTSPQKPREADNSRSDDLHNPIGDATWSRRSRILLVQIWRFLATETRETEDRRTLDDRTARQAAKKMLANFGTRKTLSAGRGGLK